MKITDVTVTLFAWDDIPATAYGRMTGRFGGKSQLGLALDADNGLITCGETQSRGIALVDAPGPTHEHKNDPEGNGRIRECRSRRRCKVPSENRGVPMTLGRFKGRSI